MSPSLDTLSKIAKSLGIVRWSPTADEADRRIEEIVQANQLRNWTQPEGIMTEVPFVAQGHTQIPEQMPDMWGVGREITWHVVAHRGRELVKIVHQVPAGLAFLRGGIS